ncbi:hypothetical protein SDC9_96716 [bioreactor metagenome]|uniref:Uncharacterized protein n=1 Tax=bioreactor metagenome TaxID=1076179 RepID=A0A645A9Y8_9ZZZZ
MNDRIISWYGEHADQIASLYGPSDAKPRNTLLQKWIPSESPILEICGVQAETSSIIPFLNIVSCCSARRSVPKSPQKC